MAVANLTNELKQIITGRDSIAIIDNFQSIRGGATLNVVGFTPEVIESGHVIIQSTNDPKDYKPMPIKADLSGYEALPENHKYVGILVATITTDRPFAGIMVRGTINRKAVPFDFATIEDAVIAALPHLDVRED